MLLGGFSHHSVFPLNMYKTSSIVQWFHILTSRLEHDCHDWHKQLALLAGLKSSPSSLHVSLFTPTAGDHKQARKAELQSRAELHKARLDALNAKQRHLSSAAAKQSSQVGVSPMTQKVITDLTAARSPIPASKLSQVAPAMAAAAAPGPAVAKPAPSLSHTTPVAEAAHASSFKTKAADPPKAAKPAAPSAVAAATNRSRQMQPPAATSVSAAPAAMAAGTAAGTRNGAAVVGRLDKSASSKEIRPGSPASSRLAPKRRSSRSGSPAATGSKGGRSQAGSQRQAVSSAHRHATTRCGSSCHQVNQLPGCIAVKHALQYE